MNAVRDLTGDIRHGRLRRVEFVLYILATLAFILPVAVLVAGSAASIAVTVGAVIGKPLGSRWPLYALATPFIALVGFVWANLLAKRARDTGLPGWATVAIIFLLGQASHYAMPGFADRVIGLIVLMGLLFVPSDTFRLASPRARQ